MLRVLIVVVVLFPVYCFSQNQTIPANGFARYSELGDELYIAALYSEFTSQDPSVIRSLSNVRMEMKITTERVAYRKLARLFVSSSAINNRPEVLTANADAMEAFLGSFQDHLYWGDHIVINRVAEGVTVAINGVALTQIDSPDLFNVLLNIWIGDVPPSREFKAQILGAESTDDLQAAFLNVNFQPERVAAIESWLSDAEESVAAEEVAPSPRPQPVAQAQPTPTRRPPPVVVAPTIAAPRADTATQTESADAAAQQEEPQVAVVSRPPVQTEPEPEPEDTFDDEFSAENLLAAQLYANKLLIHSQRNMSYPNISRRLGQQGTVVASVTIDRDGALLDYILTEESNHSPLNSAVKKGVRRSEPFPEIPRQIRGESFTFRVPVTFRFSE